MEAENFDWNGYVKRFNNAVRRLPLQLGNEALLFTKDAFRQQGWLGDRLEKWPPRKQVTKWGVTPRNKGRAILMDKGRLRRGNRIVRHNINEVVLGNDVPYARAHNDGFRGKVAQRVKEFTRKQTFAGIASSFKVQGVGVITGARSSVKTKKAMKPAKVQAMVRVKAHSRTINMRLPRRRFMGHSQYLNKRLYRKAQANIQKALNTI
jgi:hypothetical protein